MDVVFRIGNDLKKRSPKRISVTVSFKTDGRTILGKRGSEQLQLWETCYRWEIPSRLLVDDKNVEQITEY